VFLRLRTEPETFLACSIVTGINKETYETDDGKRDGTCQDWEMEATFFNWRKRCSEEQALTEMARVFGEEYPAKGMRFAMGTHSLYPETWLINGVVRLDEVNQGTLF
jgi:hypothetical protein